MGVPTYELETISGEILKDIRKVPGHYTLKVDPLFPKKILHEAGFYYCDTLVHLSCPRKKFVGYDNPLMSLSTDISLDELIELCLGIFVFDRFHRDFNVDSQAADRRYINWIKELYHSGMPVGLYYDETLVGFAIFKDNRFALQGLKKTYQGKGYAKYFWSLKCLKIYSLGYQEVLTTISAANCPLLNMYAALGFRFDKAEDVYHLCNNVEPPLGHIIKEQQFC